MPSSDKPTRKLAAIMFTDIANYTALSAKDSQKALKILGKQDQIVKPIINSHSGNLLKEIGDGLLVIFNSVTSAVECAIDIQEKTKSIDSLDLRIGIHEGEVTIKNSDVFGDDVNIASRIEPFSAVGGIAISDKIQRAISSNKDFKTAYVGKPKLKGVEQTVEIYCIVSHKLPKTDISKVYANLEKENSKYNIFAVIGGLLTIFGLLLWIYLSFYNISFNFESHTKYLKGKKSIAVLYFDSFSSDEDSEFWCSGMTEAVITALSKLGAFNVKSRNEVIKFKNKAIDFNQIRKVLNVNTFLQGSLQKFKDKIRVSAQLIDAKTGNNLWAGSYDRSNEDIFLIQDDISQEIAKTLGIEIANIQEDILRAQPTTNIKAYEMLGKAIYLSDNGLYNNAIEVLDSVLVLDPNYNKALYTKGIVLENVNMFQEAESIYKKLLPKTDHSSRINWNWNFPNLNNINNDIKSAKSYSFPLHYESGIGVLSQKYKEKEFIYGIDIKNNKEIWRKSINDSYLSDPFIWNHLLINISNRYYPTQKGEAAIFVHELNSGKLLFAHEFPRDYPEQTIYPFVLDLQGQMEIVSEPLLVYLKVDEGSSLINLDPSNGTLIWNIKISDNVDQGLPILWSLFDKNNNQFILHRKGNDLYLINLESGIIEWNEKIDTHLNKMVILNDRALFFNSGGENILIKNIIKQKEVANHNTNQPIINVIIQNDQFIIGTEKSIFSIDSQFGFFNFDLIDWNIEIDSDDKIFKINSIGDNIVLNHESGSIWFINEETGKIINKTNSEIRDLKLRWDDTSKKIIGFTNEFVLGLDYYNGEIIWKIHDNDFYNQPYKNIQFIGDKLIQIQSGKEKNDLIINCYSSATGDLLWDKTENSAFEINENAIYSMSNAANDICAFEQQLYIYNQNQIIGIDIKEKPNNRIVPKKDILLRLGSIYKDLKYYDKADSVLNEVVNNIDQQNEEAILLLADVYRKKNDIKQFNKVVADYINLLSNDSKQKLDAIELLKDESDLKWIIQMDCEKNSIIDHELIMFDYNCSGNQLYKLFAYRQHTGIKVWELELDLNRALSKLQNNENLYITGQKHKSESNCASPACEKNESYVFSINKKNGNINWNYNLSPENDKINFKKMYLFDNLIIIEFMIKENVFINAINLITGELLWERMWETDRFYSLSETDLAFYNQSIFIIFDNKINSFSSIDGRDLWSYEFEDFDEITYFNQYGIIKDKMIFINDEDELVFFDISSRNIIWSEPLPISRVVTTKISFSQEGLMYFHTPDGQIYVFSLMNNKPFILWEKNFNDLTEWIGADDKKIYIFIVNKNQTISLSINDGSILSEKYLIWEPNDISINNSSIFSIGNNNIYCQEFSENKDKK